MAKKSTKKTDTAKSKKTTKDSSPQEKPQRLAIFIDGNNFRHGIRALTGDENIDWKTFLKELERDYEITQSNYYIGKLTSPLFEAEMVQEQERLLNELKKVGISPTLGYFNDDKSEKGVDVQIALDLAVGAVKGHFEVAILISGDGDLSKSVKIAQTYGVRVILGYIAGTKTRGYRISWILKDITDSQAALNDQVKKAHKKWKELNEKKEKKEKKEGTKKTKDTKKKTTSKKSAEKKSVSSVLVFSDGGSRGNPGPGGCGAVISDDKGKVLSKVSEFIGHCTNNQAEYMALLYGLAEAEKLKPKSITCYSDSKLVVEQVSGNWKVKNKELKEYYEQVKLFLKKHPNTKFHHIPRAKNQLADQLANEAMDRGK